MTLLPGLVVFLTVCPLAIWAQDLTEQQRFNKAAEALAAADYRTAEAGFQAVLKTSPKNIGALGNLGVVYSRTQQIDKAIAVYRKALALQPSDRQLLLNLGLAYLREDAAAEALPVFRKLTSIAPGDARAQELLAHCELYAGDARKAVASLEALRARDAANPALVYLLGVGYLKLKEKERAQAAFEAFLVTAPPARAALVMCKAYYDSGLMAEAEQQCRQAIAADASLEGAQRELGKVLVSRRDPNAESVLRKAVAADRSDAESLYFLGALLVQNSKMTDAVPLLERARELNPGFWGNYFYLGRARLQAKDAAGAITLLEKAADLNSSESSVYYQLGRAYTAAGKPEAAKRAMDRVRELKADAPAQ